MADGRPLIEVLNFRHWCRSQVRPRWELGGWENEFYFDGRERLGAEWRL